MFMQKPSSVSVAHKSNLRSCEQSAGVGQSARPQIRRSRNTVQRSVVILTANDDSVNGTERIFLRTS